MAGASTAASNALRSGLEMSAAGAGSAGGGTASSGGCAAVRRYAAGQTGPPVSPPVAVVTWATALVARKMPIAGKINVRTFMLLRWDTDAWAARRFRAAALFFFEIGAVCVTRMTGKRSYLIDPHEAHPRSTARVSPWRIAPCADDLRARPAGPAAGADRALSRSPDRAHPAGVDLPGGHRLRRRLPRVERRPGGRGRPALGSERQGPRPLPRRLQVDERQHRLDADARRGVRDAALGRDEVGPAAQGQGPGRGHAHQHAPAAG